MAQSLPLYRAPGRVGLAAKMIRALRDFLQRSAEREELTDLAASQRLGRETGARC